MIALLGWELDVDKQVSAATETQVLGVLAQVQETRQGWTLRFSIPETKLAKWLAQIETVLAKGRLSPMEATQLAGRLQWGVSSVYGRGAPRPRYARATLSGGYVVRRRESVLEADRRAGGRATRVGFTTFARCPRVVARVH